MRWRVALLGALVLLGGVLLLARRGESPDDTVALERGTTTSVAAATTTTANPAPPVTTTTVATPPGQCPAMPARHALDPDRPRYTVRVDADPVTGKVGGDLTVRFTPDLAVDVLVFRLWPNGPRPASVGAHLSVGDAVSEGAVLAARQPDATTLELVLPEPIRAGRVIEVSMPWTLDVPGSVRDRISRSGDSLRLGSFLPLLAWEPGVGWAREPPTSGFAEATTTPAADWQVAITVPSGYDVLASGQRGADGRWSGVGLRDFAMSIGHFALVTATAHVPQPVTVTVGVLAGVTDSPQTYLDRVVAALEANAARFGAYPWPTYTLAITPGLQGGIEFPGHVMQGPGSTGRSTPHEVSHMWFYGLVGNNQGRDPWLDEGLATYAELRILGNLDASRARTIPPGGKGRAGEPMTYWETRQGIYYRSVYVQGAVAVASLGPVDLVDCALHLYVERNAHRIATPADLRAALEAVLPGATAGLATYGLAG